MNRKIFSQKILKSIFGVVALTSIPFISSKKNKTRTSDQVKVNINPDAVRRKNTGGRNV